MYPFASASVLLLPHACSLQSGALSQRRLLLASPTGHVIALSLDTLEPSLVWTSAPKARESPAHSNTQARAAVLRRRGYRGGHGCR